MDNAKKYIESRRAARAAAREFFSTDASMYAMYVLQKTDEGALVDVMTREQLSYEDIADKLMTLLESWHRYESHHEADLDYAHQEIERLRMLVDSDA